MAIYWMRTADVYPDARYGPDDFMAFDDAVWFPRLHMVEGAKPLETYPSSRTARRMGAGGGA